MIECVTYLSPVLSVDEGMGCGGGDDVWDGRCATREACGGRPHHRLPHTGRHERAGGNRQVSTVVVSYTLAVFVQP